MRFSSWLPLPANQALGAVIGLIVSWLPTESRRVTRTNLRLCFPELSDRDIRTLTRRSLIETGKTGCELGYIWHSPFASLVADIVNITGRELLNEALAAKKGVILLAPHLGSWETCGLYLSSCGPTTYLYKPPKLSQFEDAMIAFRSRAGARLAPTNRKGVAMLVKALEQGEIVGVLPDQEPGLEGGVFAPFFGVSALTMTLVARLAARTGAAVITVFAKRLAGGKGFEVVMQSARPGIDSPDLVEAATALNLSVEDCVRQAPAQYQWEYRRFKHQPDNSKNSLYR